MSSSIKPPSSSPVGLTSVEGAGEAGAVSPTRASGVEGSAGRVAPERAAGPSESWLVRFEAGEVTREQAIDGLVAEAIEAHGGARLSGARREQLEEVLRSALMSDPVLSRLLGPDSP